MESLLDNNVQSFNSYSSSSYCYDRVMEKRAIRFGVEVNNDCMNDFTKTAPQSYKLSLQNFKITTQ